VTSGGLDPAYSNSVLITVSSPVTLAQLHDNIIIDNNTSANFYVTIAGGTSPYTIHYTCNGVAQAPVTNYISGTNISTGTLTTGSYTYALTSVTDAAGCSAQDLGTSINVTVVQYLQIPVDSIFRTEIPASYSSGALYELGTEFQTLSDGFITKARLYSHLSEGGDHAVRVWAYNGSSYILVAGPYTWNFSSGVRGWREYVFSTPISVQANGRYIISISNSTDRYFVSTSNFSYTAHGNYLRYVRGVYSAAGSVPIYSNGNCYFRDVVFSISDTDTLTAGSIGAAQTICYNTVPAALTQLTTPFGGTGIYSYQWQSSPDNTTWTDISGATHAEYAPPALTANTYYRRAVTSGGLDPAYSNSVLITVSSPVTLAQLHDNIIIDNNTSANFYVTIAGGTSPYTIHYTCNGVAQAPVTNYISGTNISTGTLTTGSYTYALTSVTDAAGCSAQDLGTSINVTVVQYLQIPVDSIFRTEIPASYSSGALYELGTEFQTLSDGFITKARLYSHLSEGGDHAVRVWAYNGSSYILVAGPYTWNFSSGVRGWREYVFSTPISVQANGRYIISISNSTDRYFVSTSNFSYTAHGNYLRYVRGVYSAAGSVPIYSNGNCYFRDVVFAVSELTPGSIGTPQTICYNTVPESLTQLMPPSGGTRIYSYQWQSSPDNVSWSDISGATHAEYAPPALTTNTYYRRRVNSGGLDPVYSNTVLITVLPGIMLTQLHDSLTIFNNSSAEFHALITGGTSPFTINYTRNGVAQPAITNYISGSSISTGMLTTGSYTYVLTSVTDANGCSAQDLGGQITIVASDSIRYNFTYADRNSLLADGWDFNARTALGSIRNTEQTTGAIISYDQLNHPGLIRIPVDQGDVWGDYNSTRNTLFKDLPAGWTSIRLMISSFAPVHNYQQAGIMVYQDDDNYINILREYDMNNRIVFARENNGNPLNLRSVSENATTNIYLRLDRDSVTENITSYYSLNGSVWTLIADVIKPVNNPRLAIIVGGDNAPGGYPNADIAWAEISTRPLPPIIDTLSIHPGSLVFKAIEGQPSSDTRSVFISTTIGRSVLWHRTADVPWLTFDQESGISESVLKVGINSTGMISGVYHGNITLSSTQVSSDPYIVPVTLIINPNVPVTATTWKDGKEGAMSVSVDDGLSSGFEALHSNGYKGTYVSIGTAPPVFYTSFYNSGMELGSHLVSHLCNSFDNNTLRMQEIEPNISGICANTPQPCQDLITLVWPCGFTNYREQAVAAEYFLSARGYNINKLEDATPQNFMNLKSYNSHEHAPYPPADLKTVVDSAVIQKKWFNLVLHAHNNDDGAVSYAHTTYPDRIWVTSIGEVIKYLMQRDRFILTDYSTDTDLITFKASRLSVPSSSFRSFETAFGVNDSATLQIDINDGRDIQYVLIDSVTHSYRTKVVNGNTVLLTNIRLEPSVAKTVEIKYYNDSVPRLRLSTHTLNFVTEIGSNPDNQTFNLTSNLPDSVSWTIAISDSLPDWLEIIPVSGSGNGTMLAVVNVSGLAAGNYNKTVTITSPQAINSPQFMTVNLTVNSPLITISATNIDFVGILNNQIPVSQSLHITNDATPSLLSWSGSVNVPWLSLNPQNGVTPDTIEVIADQDSLAPGVYHGIITINSTGAANSPQLVNVSLTVYPEGCYHYDFTYANRDSLLAHGWSFIATTSNGDPRDTEQRTGALVSYDQQAHPGIIRIPVDVGDLWSIANDTRNSLFHDLPSDWTSIRLKIASFNPIMYYQQAGLYAYQNDDNYVMLTRIFNGDNRIAFANEAAGSASLRNSVSESATSNLYLRLDRDLDTNLFTSYYSVNGFEWTIVGVVAQELNNPRLGIVSGSSPGGFPNADIAWAEVLTNGATKSADEVDSQHKKPVSDKGSMLYQNYPNPFADYTWIDYNVTEDSHVIIEVFNSSGQKVETILNQYIESGSYRLIWNASNLPLGVYYLTLKTGSYTGTIRMTLIQQ